MNKRDTSVNKDTIKDTIKDTSEVTIKTNPSAYEEESITLSTNNPGTQRNDPYVSDYDREIKHILDLDLSTIAPSLTKASVSKQQMDKIAEIIAVSFDMPSNYAFIAIILLFLNGAAS